MGSKSMLVFDLDGTRYGVDTEAVLEAVWLPKLAVIEEAPPWIVGMFSLRGHVVVAVDLYLRFGHASRHYRLSDQIVVLKTDNLLVGLIVSEVLAVVDVDIGGITPAPDFDGENRVPGHLASGVVWIGDESVTLLAISNLIHWSDAPHFDEDLTFTKHDVCLYDDIGAETDERLRSRAAALRQTAVAEDAEDRIGLAVVELAGEYFGVELLVIQEFCSINLVTPIPCCPPHILGAMSLRGNLLAVIDPSSALNQPLMHRYSKAVIVKLENNFISVAFDEVHDVVYLRNSELHDPPSAIRESLGSQVIGTAKYAGKTVTILDLPALIAREEWVVNENV